MSRKTKRRTWKNGFRVDPIKAVLHSDGEFQITEGSDTVWLTVKQTKALKKLLEDI